MILAGFLSYHLLLQSRQGAERIDDYLSNRAVGTEVQLSLGNVSGVIRNCVGDISTRQRSHGDDGDGATGWELGSLLVDLRQVRVEGAGHRVLRGDLVHLIGDNGQRISVVGHIR